MQVLIMKTVLSLFFILVFYIIQQFWCEGLIINLKDVQSLGKLLPFNTYLNNTATSVYMCVDICYRFKFCKSVNFLASERLCMLNSADSSTVQLVTAAESRYVERAKIPTAVVKEECIGHFCPIKYLCLNTSSCGQWRDADCGPIKEDNTAIIEYTGTWPYTTAKYQCKRPMPPSQPSVVTMTCLRSGKWTKPSVQCATSCRDPPEVRIEQVMTFTYIGSEVFAYYTCNSFPDPSPTVSCPLSKCVGSQSWTAASLSCSAADCFNTATRTYAGKMSCTNTGRTCQVWGSTFPHSPNFLPHQSEMSTNYCRPLDNGVPWCYTVDPAVRWENCPVPEC